MRGLQMASKSRSLRNLKVVTENSYSEASIQQVNNQNGSNASSQSQPVEQESCQPISDTGIEMIDIDGRRFRKRGRTTMSSIWNMEKGEKIFVEVDGFGVPCSREGATLGSFLGTIAVNEKYAPLDMPRWDSKDYKSFRDDILTLVQEKAKTLEAERSEGSSTSLAKMNEEIFQELTGPEHHGRVRGMGSGVTPTRYFGSTRYNIGDRWHNSTNSSESEEVKDLKEQVKNMSKTVEALSAFIKRQFQEQQWMPTEVNNPQDGHSSSLLAISPFISGASFHHQAMCFLLQDCF